ncbi:MAG TPA: sodium:solute symporter [Vicinamibacterales bacterium]|nr:sodium:solute symporter [Vicinamibacterales bacterium]
MRVIDWLVVAAYLTWVIVDGLRMSRRTKEMEGYLLASRSLPWWAVGLSVMATQLSAITMTSTTGQGYADGLRFVQFYFGLPIAMIILSVTVVPFFMRARVYTAYEYLERRFDLKTRTLTAVLFLISRGLSCSVIIAAPALILSIILGWNLTLTVLAIGLPTVLYTMIGGVQAVTWTDVKQMGIVVFGILAAVAVLILGLPDGMGLGSALHVAGAAGKMQALDFRFDLTQKYTFWSGMIGAVFLFLSYFGCDQSQVQRYLTAKSVQQGRQSLFVSAFVKIPLQALILFTGVLVFLFFLFNRGPMLFNSEPLEGIKAGPHAAEYAAMEREYDAAFEVRREAATALAGRGDDASRAAFLAADQAVRDVRSRASALVRDATHANYADVNYVFPSFVLNYMPAGLTGLLIAAIFLAAMSSSGGELNSLATTTVIDVYRRHLKPDADDAHYLLVSKLATAGWGVFVCIAAVYAVQLGSLIEVVNRYGSYFYGSILGVFILAIGTKRANGHGAFVGLIGGMVAVGLVAGATKVEFLWLNVVGAVAVTVVGLIVSALTRPAAAR